MIVLPSDAPRHLVGFVAKATMTAASGSRDALLLGLRLLLAVWLCGHHGLHKIAEWRLATAAGETWPLTREIAAMHLPWPSFLAIAATVIQCVCAALLAPGLLTRGQAAMLGIVLAFALLQNLLAGRSPEVATLYLGLLLTLIVFGPGRWSLDTLLLHPHYGKFKP